MTIMKKARERGIMYLQSKAVGTPIEEFVEQVISHYKDLIDIYTQTGSNALRNAVMSESNPQMKSILDIEVSDGVSLSSYILEHIN